MRLYKRHGIGVLLCLQAMLCSSRIGTAALSGYQIILQLWLATSYAADGFATAANVLLSRGLGELRSLSDDTKLMSIRRSLRSLSNRVLFFGLLIGAACGAIFAVEKKPLIRIFTRDAATIDAINEGPLWILLCSIQPINSLAFVYDGLMYAGQGFAFISRTFVAGFVLFYGPLIIAGFVLEDSGRSSLVWIWGAKAAFNVWRTLSCAWYVERRILQPLQSPNITHRDKEDSIEAPLLGDGTNVDVIEPADEG